MTDPACTIRPWQPGDDLAGLTRLLHRAHAPLAAAGMNFTAVSQTAAMTAQRMRGAPTWVAVQAGGSLVGTTTAAGPSDPHAPPWAHGLPWVYRDGVAMLRDTAMPSAVLRRRLDAAAIVCVQGDETWATRAAPPAWRTAAAIGACRRDAAPTPLPTPAT